MTNGNFDRALALGRPPNIQRLFPNSRALIVDRIEWSVDCVHWHSSGPGSGLTVTIAPITTSTTTIITTTASEVVEELFLRVGATRH